MKGRVVYILLFLLFIIAKNRAYGQARLDTLILDSIKIAPKSKFISKMVKWGIKSIRNSPPDTTQTNIKSEDVFRRFEGKHIGHIIIKRVDFEEQVTDTSQKLVYWGTQIMNNIHSKTKDWVIRNNLFIREGDTIESYKIADNERYLRNLPFISDARIYVRSYLSMPDTVDLVVVTKDLFSITGGLDFSNINHVKGQLAEANFLGMGQKIELDGIMDQERSPKTGYDLLYRKYNVFGSFIDAQVGYSVIGENSYDQKEDEIRYYMSLDKPLISPNNRTAGGLYLARRVSDNLYPKRADSQFYRYKGIVLDGWGGYNIAGKKLMSSKVRDRKFIALRYAQNKFDQLPYQVQNKLNPVFNDMQLALGAITFFRQDYYKTRYIYGFGTTEDIPYGYKISFVGGWMEQYYLNRVFAGIKADAYSITHRGYFCRYYLRAGGFYDNKTWQDAGVLAGASVYSRLYYVSGMHIRQYLSANYTRLFRIVAGEPLRIDNTFGLPQFSYQYVTGYQRFSVNAESTVYLRPKLLGFKFAPFADLNFSALTPLGMPAYKADLYPGVGGGIRTRNENLVFGTIELKGMYFPQKIEGYPNYKIELNTNIKFRYNSNYVSAPDVLKWNTDDNQ